MKLLASLLIPLLALSAGYTPNVPLARLPFPEVSGLAASKRHPGVYWAIQDSGNPAQLIAVWVVAGKPVRSRAIAVTGAPNIDWEEVAVAPDGHLWIADSGNNDEDRTNLRLLRVPEPDPNTARSVAVSGSVPFYYPDAPPWGKSFDAESLFFVDGAAYLVTKTAEHGVYRFPRLTPGRAVTLKRIGRVTPPPRGLGGLVTAVAVSADNRRLALVTAHRRVWVYEARQLGLTGDARVMDLLHRVPRWSTPFTRDEAAWQVEAVSFAPSGHDLVLAAEEGPLWVFPSHFYETNSY